MKLIIGFTTNKDVDEITEDNKLFSYTFEKFEKDKFQEKLIENLSDEDFKIEEDAVINILMDLETEKENYKGGCMLGYMVVENTALDVIDTLSIQLSRQVTNTLTKNE